jgi:hypothetical protein
MSLQLITAIGRSLLPILIFEEMPKYYMIVKAAMQMDGVKI